MTGGARARGIVLALAFAAALLGFTPTAHADVAAQGCSARAVVVVQPGPGPVQICFDGAISGLRALELAGASPVTYGFAGQGGAVCMLFGHGNPPDQSCLIGDRGQFWAYYRAAPGAGGWTFSRAGASTTTVVDGSVEGWSYGTGGPPGFVSFCAVVSCAPPPTAAPPPPPPTAAPVTPVAPPANGTAATGGATTTTGTDGAKSATGKAGADGATATAGKDGTAAGEKDTVTGERSSRRDASDSAALAASRGGGGGDSGSPVGVIVAVVVVAASAGGGLVLRHRRRGAASG